jgi:hypothetical protein
LASSAPDTFDRLVVIVASSPWSCISSRVSRCHRLPISLPGRMNIGITASATRLSCHESQNIAASTSARLSSIDTDRCSNSPTARGADL